ncbi:GNAT family N-acetyltransferase [Aquibacillus kalidii]|uniref:GNAT family N-acetyltransferase n=1 Tax=Aquibacillus kalidii TaxID=2762597 RepID=UPI001C99A16A|nr:GNAT family N-acetyltransferase [Aquibacillus kalidii]
MERPYIEEVISIDRYIIDLSRLLIKVVDSGASIGFIPPLDINRANIYWDNVLNEDTVLFVAKFDKQTIGTIQLHLCSKENGDHRAEVAKLMVDPAYRRLGIAKMLMEVVENKALSEGRQLLVLDTREGDPSNQLYLSLGYKLAGTIPCFARSGTGKLDATNLYYKTMKEN